MEIHVHVYVPRKRTHISLNMIKLTMQTYSHVHTCTFLVQIDCIVYTFPYLSIAYIL